MRVEGGVVHGARVDTDVRLPGRVDVEEPETKPHNVPS